MGIDIDSSIVDGDGKAEAASGGMRELEARLDALRAEAAEAEAPPSDPAPSPAEAASQVSKILEQLLPEGEAVIVTTVFGETWETPLVVSIRKQRHLLKLIRKVWANASEGENTLETIAEHLLSDEGLDDLLAAFEAIHVDQLQEFRNGDEARSQLSAEDIVSLEDCVQAVLPFCVKPLASLAKEMMPALTRATESS